LLTEPSLFVSSDLSVTLAPPLELLEADGAAAVLLVELLDVSDDEDDADGDEVAGPCVPPACLGLGLGPDFGFTPVLEDEELEPEVEGVLSLSVEVCAKAPAVASASVEKAMTAFITTFISIPPEVD
jgi:hypothetical protein